MTKPDFRALCAELLDELDLWSSWHDAKDLKDRAGAALDLSQPELVAPTDEELYELWEESGFENDRFARAVLVHWGRPTTQPEEADIHYVWELEDAEGEWQAGGSANSLEDVQREGNRYLQTYSQDGPHKLIIQRHCVSTIEEATSD